MKTDKKKKIALFRFGVIAGILTVKETEKGEREKRIGEVTSKEWDIPYSGRSYIGSSTVRDWLKLYEDGGNIESLFPCDRSDQGKTRCMDSMNPSQRKGTCGGLRRNCQMTCGNRIVCTALWSLLTADSVSLLGSPS